MVPVFLADSSMSWSADDCDLKRGLGNVRQYQLIEDSVFVIARA